MRIPWLVLGALAGFITAALLFPALDDRTYTRHCIVAVVCMVFGIGTGLLLDKRRKMPSS